MFLVLLRYTGALDTVDALLHDHRAFLERHYASGRFMLSGRRVPRVGGVILARGDDEDALREVLREDPFHVAGVAEYELIQVAPTMAHSAIAEQVAAELAAATGRADQVAT
ncbi:MAG TPA: YciI family protein [Oscillatoriaceae cyanobacterium]